MSHAPLTLPSIDDITECFFGHSSHIINTISFAHALLRFFFFFFIHAVTLITDFRHTSAAIRLFHALERYYPPCFHFRLCRFFAIFAIIRLWFTLMPLMLLIIDTRYAMRTPCALGYAIRHGEHAMFICYAYALRSSLRLPMRLWQMVSLTR